MSYLGIDIGGTKVALKAAGPGAAVHETVFRWPSFRGTRHDLAALSSGVRAVHESLTDDVEAVGVAIPATVDRTGTVVTWPGRPGWAGFDLAGSLDKLFPGIPVRYADDGDLAALAEAHEAGVRDLVHLGVGTGVGGGMVLDGRLCPGSRRGSCEAGHMIVDRRGPECDCGRHGCLQAVASGPATLRRAAVLCGRDVSFTELRAALAAERPWAVDTLEESCAALAAAATSLAELVHPDRITIGGGFAASLPGFVERVRRHARQLTRAGGAPVVLADARLGALSSLQGALLLARVPA
ncbi:ROK family protein [Streptomyces sp. NBC_01653]|uniref:ROK family protein n=1 Tax=Streptomyces sp. NBC_01653 TaxID=2975908 RepID=UPI00386EE78C|nr:ROK family protein [Streptomyces sp. NBC_01653]